MSEPITFIKERAVATISAAKTIASDWTWPEKTIAAYELQLAGITGDHDATPPLLGQEEIVAAANQSMLSARGAWDVALDQLHIWTQQGVGMAKIKYRNDPSKASQLDSLKARSTSRSETLKEALAWEAAWQKIDPAWSPLPVITLPAFTTLRKQGNEDLQTAYAEKQAEWSAANDLLHSLGDALEDINQSWYADATRAFPESTPQGQMIRSTIPTTTYTPPPSKPATPPTP